MYNILIIFIKRSTNSSKKSNSPNCHWIVASMFCCHLVTDLESNAEVQITFHPSSLMLLQTPSTPPPILLQASRISSSFGAWVLFAAHWYYLSTKLLFYLVFTIKGVYVCINTALLFSTALYIICQRDFYSNWRIHNLLSRTTSYLYPSYHSTT